MADHSVHCPLSTACSRLSYLHPSYSGLLPIIIPVAAVVAFLLLLLILLVVVIVCCTAQRRRQKKTEKRNSYDYVIPTVGYSSAANGDDKEGYAEIGKKDTVKHEYTYVTNAEASIEDANGIEKNGTAVESSAEGQVKSEHTYYNTVNGGEVLQNKNAVEEKGEKGSSAEYAAIPAVPPSATRTSPPPSWDYAIIPDKEPVDVLYDSAEAVPKQKDTQATPPTVDYAPIEQKAEQKDKGDTEQSPPVPAFDLEILYTQPDKNRQHEVGGYETVPDTPGSATVGDYEAVDVIQKSPCQPAGVTQTADMPEVAPLDPEVLYTEPNKGEKMKHDTQMDADSDYEAVQSAGPSQQREGGGPVQVGQDMYATPDMSKKMKKPVEEEDTPPEVPEYQPIITDQKPDDTK